MSEYCVYYNPDPKDYFVGIDYFEAESPKDALEQAKKKLPKSAKLIRADKMPEWFVDAPITKELTVKP
jgi:hypothetical protein